MDNKMSYEEISALCLELSMLLRAGVMVGDALSLLAEESEGERSALLQTMARQVDGGVSLSGAMEASGRFPVYVRGLVEVGERSGRTEAAAQRPSVSGGDAGIDAGGHRRSAGAGAARV